MKVTFAILLIAASWLMVGCKRSPLPTPLPADVLATVEGHPIRLADLFREGEPPRQPHDARLRELIKFQSIYARAKQAGFDQQPEIARKIKTFIVEQYLQEQLRDQPQELPVSQAEIESYYREHADRYAIGEKVRFAVIRIGFSTKATEQKKAEAAKKAESVLAEARAINFGALAQRYSQDQATRYAGGDAGWVARGESSRWNRAVIEAAFGLMNPGDLSAVIQTSNACYLVKLIEKQPASQRPLKEVAEAIRYQLAVEKRQRMHESIYEELMTGLQIEINQDLLKSLPAPAKAPDSNPSPLPKS